jgi:hypothetical protein
MPSGLTAATRLNWIDVHHHCYHADLVTALRGRGVTQMAPGVPLPEWTAADSPRVMDSAGVPAAVLSPGRDSRRCGPSRLPRDQEGRPAHGQGSDLGSPNRG